MKMKFITHDVTDMQAELAVVRERVHKLVLIREFAASHKLEQILRVRVPKQAAAWKREDGFDRNEIIAERYRRTLRRLYAGDDPEPFIEIQYNIRRLSTPEEFTEGMESEVNRLW